MRLHVFHFIIVMAGLSLKITEIFYSLQGEARTVGLPTVFIRLTGCPLRCQYCDTEYAFTGGESMTIDSILEKVASYNPRYICVTGGEPLAQKNCRQLLSRLCEAGYEVSIETSGAVDIDEIDSRVSRVMDLKTPGSKENHRNRLENLDLIGSNDQIKFVICDREDYDWSVDMLKQFGLAEKCEVLFSPSAAQQSSRDLADWIVADNLPVRFQMQLHKTLWGDLPGY